MCTHTREGRRGGSGAPRRSGIEAPRASAGPRDARAFAAIARGWAAAMGEISRATGVCRPLVRGRNRFRARAGARGVAPPRRSCGFLCPPPRTRGCFSRVKGGGAATREGVFRLNCPLARLRKFGKGNGSRAALSWLTTRRVLEKSSL